MLWIKSLIASVVAIGGLAIAHQSVAARPAAPTVARGWSCQFAIATNTDGGTALSDPIAFDSLSYGFTGPDSIGAGSGAIKTKPKDFVLAGPINKYTAILQRDLVTGLTLASVVCKFNGQDVKGAANTLYEIDLAQVIFGNYDQTTSANGRQITETYVLHSLKLTFKDVVNKTQYSFDTTGGKA